jgi:hypothetical protein
VGQDVRTPGIVHHCADSPGSDDRYSIVHY